jgi:soluble lytic murein transglycosylase-like protein
MGGALPAAVRRLTTAIVLLVAPLAPAAAADIASLETWSGPNGSSVLPRLLSSEDNSLYLRIFAAQNEGRFAEADKLLRSLRDKLLLGHVLAERYLAPGYHAGYPELAAWLKQYGDLPGAEDIYKQALKRKPRGAHPPRPAAATEPAPAGRLDSGDGYDVVARDRRARALQTQMIGAVQGGNPETAERLLERSDTLQYFDQIEYDSTRARVAAGYLYKGNSKKARRLAAAAAARSRDRLSQADWIAGLAAWREDDFAAARASFEALAGSRVASSWMVAAGGYWASRAAIRAGQPELVIGHLEQAARHPRTFYGLLALRELGIEPQLDWELPPLDGAAATRLLAMPATQRAMALAELGRHDLAEREVLLLQRALGPTMAAPVLGLVSRLDMAHLQMRLGTGMRNAAGKRYDATTYPLPAWTPPGGFAIDRALVFALMRQESAFNTRATSRAGARGLMQLMPKTASFVAQDSSLKGSNRSKLYSPDFNVGLGQQYIVHLLDETPAGDNLFWIAAAYNGGPGNLARWLKTIDHGNDPLLFIESIPNRETRGFIERVLSNYWIYRYRLGQDLDSLDQVASGEWPRYRSEDYR